LLHELRKGGLQVEQQYPVPVYYDGVQVGDFYADLLVESTLLVELKAVEAFHDAHTAQCLNYLRGTGFSLCLLVYFGNSKVQIKRLRN
jgi:GxxExxY protein